MAGRMVAQTHRPARLAAADATLDESSTRRAEHAGADIRSTTTNPQGAEATELAERDAAIAAWRKILEGKPNDADALRGLALALIAQGRRHDALPPLRMLANCNPDKRQLWVLLARTAEEAGDYGAAVWAWRHLARSDALDLRPKKSLSRLRGMQEARHFFAEINRSGVRNSRVAARGSSAFGDITTAVAKWWEVLKLKPGDPEALQALLTHSDLVKRSTDLIAQNDIGGLKRLVSSASRRKPPPWELPFLQFRLSLARGKHLEAAHHLAGLPVRAPFPTEEAGRDIILGACRGSTDSALSSVVDALLRSNSPDVLGGAAIGLLEAGRSEVAEQILQQSIARHSDPTMVKSLLHQWIKVALRTSHPRSALVGLESLLNIDSGHDRTNIEYLYVCESLGESARGLAHIRRMQQPWSTGVRLAVASFQARLQRFAEARLTLEDLPEQERSKPAAGRVAADVFRGLGDWAGAAERFRDIAARTNEPGDYVQLAQCLEAGGAKELATEAYLTALEIDRLCFPAYAALLDAKQEHLAPLAGQSEDRPHQQALFRAQAALARQKPEQALDELAGVPDDVEPLSVGLLRASTLRKMGRIGDAVSAYQGLVEQFPRHYRVYGELILSLCSLGDYPAARALLDRVPSQLFLMGASRAMWGRVRREVFFGVGELRNAWKAYWDDPSVEMLKRAPGLAMARRRDELNATEKDLLTVACFGIGDELRWTTIYGELQSERPGLQLTCEPRLHSLLCRSFPELRFTPSRRTMGRPIPEATRKQYEELPYRQLGTFFDNVGWRAAQEAKRVCLVTDWLTALRPNLAQFPLSPRHPLSADPTERATWRQYLDDLPNQRSIGISWHSATVNVERNVHYTDLRDWRPIFQTPGVNFVNLQYDADQADIEEAEQRFGVKIWTPPDIDLRNDVASIAALSAELDLVLAPCNMLAELAGAVGTTCVLMSNAPSLKWRTRPDGQDRWFSSVRLVFGDKFFDKPSLIDNTARAVVRLLETPGAVRRLG